MIDLEKIKEALYIEPEYRLKQTWRALFRYSISSWDEITTLPLGLREKLNQYCPIEIKTDELIERNDTIKARIILNDDLKVETVLMRHKDSRNTVCVSSQVGCPLGCLFCATGSMGFKRNITTSEIVGQVLFFSRLLKKTKEKVTNVVFMGMGEPFLNYDSVIGAVKILNDKYGFNIGARHISISTIGILEGIEMLSRENLQVNLAISFHAPDNIIRSKLMPFNKTVPIEKLLTAVDSYINKTKRQVMFEYLLIDGVNDSNDCALRLADLLNKPLYFLNLIIYNPTGVGMKPSSAGQVEKFKNILRKKGIKLSERYRFGQKIQAACGQLAVK